MKLINPNNFPPELLCNLWKEMCKNDKIYTTDYFIIRTMWDCVEKYYNNNKCTFINDIIQSIRPHDRIKLYKDLLLLKNKYEL